MIIMIPQPLGWLCLWDSLALSSIAADEGTEPRREVWGETRVGSYQILQRWQPNHQDRRDFKTESLISWEPLKFWANQDNRSPFAYLSFKNLVSVCLRWSIVIGGREGCQEDLGTDLEC